MKITSSHFKILCNIDSIHIMNFIVFIFFCFSVPVQYIVRNWDFRCTRLQLIPPVFIPRQETETLIDIVKQNVNILNRVLEIGCGSGAISISLLQENENVNFRE